MSGPARGSVVVDELVVPIVDMWLADGMLVFAAEVWGPVRAVSTGDYRLHDRDGGLVFRAYGISGLTWPEVPAGSRLVVTCEVSIRGKTAHGC
jgi:hypothetical protein